MDPEGHHGLDVGPYHPRDHDFYIDTIAAPVLVRNCGIPATGSRMSVDDALDTAQDYLGEGYSEQFLAVAVTSRVMEPVLCAWATLTLPAPMVAAYTAL